MERPSFAGRSAFLAILLDENGVWRSLASAIALGAMGRRFKSCHPDLFFRCVGKQRF